MMGLMKTKILMGMADSPGEVEGKMETDVSPPGYLPRNDVVTTPFTTKQVENILQSVIVTYKRYSTDKSFECRVLF